MNNSVDDLLARCRTVLTADHPALRYRFIDNTLVKAVLLMAVVHVSPAYAAAVSYSHVEASYTQFETDGPQVANVTVGGIVREPTIRVTARLTNRLFLYGSLGDGDLSDINGLDELDWVSALGADEVEADATIRAYGAGAGMEFLSMEQLSLYARAGYVRRKVVVSFQVGELTHVADVAADGPQIAAGARAVFGRTELFAEAAYTEISNRQQGGGMALEAGFELDFSPRIAARFSYVSIAGDPGFTVSARWYYRR